MVNERDFAGSAENFQKVFEIARRYKIMNPEKVGSQTHVRFWVTTNKYR